MPPFGKIKLLIVDDSLFFRKSLERGLSKDSRIEIIGMAVDPFDAMEKIKQLNPDVVTLDVEMPKLNGIDFLKKLMPVHPLPVVVVSSAPVSALDALEAGAVDFVKKPEIKSSQALTNFIDDLIVKIKIASTAKIPTRRVPARPAAATSVHTAPALSLIHIFFVKLQRAGDALCFQHTARRRHIDLAERKAEPLFKPLLDQTRHTGSLLNILDLSVDNGALGVLLRFNAENAKHPVFNFADHAGHAARADIQRENNPFFPAPVLCVRHFSIVPRFLRISSPCFANRKPHSFWSSHSASGSKSAT